MARYIEINDLNLDELAPYVRLTGAQLRSTLDPDRALIIAESPTVIGVALDRGCIPVSILTDKRLINSDVRGIIERLDSMGFDVPVYTGERDLLARITGFELTRGALAAFKRPRESNIREILSTARRVAVLEEIADSTNIGAIFRSAAALGVDAVLVTPTCCDPFSRRAIRVSMGTAFMIPWCYIGKAKEDWPSKGMGLLREYGFKTVAMALSNNSVSIDDPCLDEDKLAIILGTEGTGLKSETIKEADFVTRIPMSRGVDSLNVGAAAAIAFYRLCRKNDTDSAP